jgi:uncharacterized protein (DUF433 family)
VVHVVQPASDLVPRVDDLRLDLLGAGVCEVRGAESDLHAEEHREVDGAGERADEPSRATRGGSGAPSEGGVSARIVATPGTCSGAPRLAGRRITIEQVMAWFMDGTSMAQIATELRLEVADVHECVRFALLHGTWRVRRNGQGRWVWDRRGIEPSRAGESDASGR